MTLCHNEIEKRVRAYSCADRHVVLEEMKRNCLGLLCVASGSGLRNLIANWAPPGTALLLWRRRNAQEYGLKPGGRDVDQSDLSRHLMS